jgi:hypothetical protein
LKTDNVKIQIHTGDARGFSLIAPAEVLDFLGRVADIHPTSIAAGAVWGNHYDLRRRGAVVRLAGGARSLRRAVRIECAMTDQRLCGSRLVGLRLTIQERRWHEKWCRGLAFLRDLGGISSRSLRVKSFSPDDKSFSLPRAQRAKNGRERREQHPAA